MQSDGAKAPVMRQDGHKPVRKESNDMKYLIEQEHTEEEITQYAHEWGTDRLYVTMDTPRDERIFPSLEDAISYITECMPEWIAEGIERPTNIGIGECKVTGDEDEPIRPTERYWTWDGTSVTPY